MAYLTLEGSREGQASYVHVHEIIKGLRRNGWDVKLFEPYYAGVDKPGLAVRLWKFLAVQVSMAWSFLKNGKPDVLYVRSHPFSWPSVMLAKALGVVVVSEVNGPYEDLFLAWPFTRRFSWMFVWLWRSQWRHSDALVTVTKGLVDWLKSQSVNELVFLIPNGADTEFFSPSAVVNPSAFSDFLPRFYAVFFGALARWQGVDTMLEAVKSPYWPQEVSLLVAGEGVEGHKVKMASQVYQRVLYLGRVSYRDIPGLVAGAVVSLCVKTRDAALVSTGLSPIKLFESLACGTPMIVSDISGQADLIREGDCGLVIPPEDPDALAKAVAYIYENPSERDRMSRAGRLLIETKHSWAIRADDTHRIIMMLLKKS
ncbi:MAG: glycosyltransferase family 4 protein [Thermanaerothrix sp.]|nr:glycosyltransferase family 4 protein [Thermanaerothrix sp.]